MLPYSLQVNTYKEARKNAGASWTVSGLVRFAFNTSASPAVALVQMQGYVIDAQEHATNCRIDMAQDMQGLTRVRVAHWQKRSAHHYSVARDMLDILTELEAELRGE